MLSAIAFTALDRLRVPMSFVNVHTRSSNSASNAVALTFGLQIRHEGYFFIRHPESDRPLQYQCYRQGVSNFRETAMATLESYGLFDLHKLLTDQEYSKCEFDQGFIDIGCE